MAELIKVKLADYKIGRAPDTLITYGLGSCVGIAIYDTKAKVGGLAHIMLPDSSQARHSENPAKFADKGISIMVDKLLKLGATKENLQAKMAGGAQMFAFNKLTDIMRIGEQNIKSAKCTLDKMNIPIVACDTGGNYGRTVELVLDTGAFKIKTINRGEKDI